MNSGEDITLVDFMQVLHINIYIYEVSKRMGTRREGVQQQYKAFVSTPSQHQPFVILYGWMYLSISGVGYFFFRSAAKRLLNHALYNN